MKITSDLKQTLVLYPHITEVYFDKFGNHYFNAHKEDGTGKLYHQIRDLQGKEVVSKNGTSVQVDKRIYEANPDHELVTTLSSQEVLATPIESEAPKFEDKDAAAIYEQKDQEIAKLRASNDDTMKALEAMKAQIEEMKKAQSVALVLEETKPDTAPQLPLGNAKK